jgi:hypothetical protein
MELVDISGKADNFTKESGKRELKMGLVCGEELREIHISDSGKMEKRMDMEYILG